MKKRVIISAIIITLIAFIFLFLSYENKLFKKKEIKIGFLGDISNENTGKAALQGVEVALEEINSNPDNTRIELIVYDSKNQLEMIEDYYNKLANEDKVMAIISTHTDNAEIAERLKVPTIFVGQDRLKAERENNFYWGIELSYITHDGISQGLKDVLATINISLSNAVIITDNSPNNERYASALKEVLPLFKMSLLGSYTLGEDISGLILKIRELNPDMVMLSMNPVDAIKFLKEAKNKNLKPKIFLGNFELSNPTLNAEYKNLPKPLYTLPYLTSILTPIPEISENTSPFLLSEILSEKKLEKITRGQKTNSIGLNAYDAMNLLGWIFTKKINIKNTPKNLQKDREELMKELWATANYKTIRGTLFADEKTGFLRRNYHRLMVITDVEGEVSYTILTQY